MLLGLALRFEVSPSPGHAFDASAHRVAQRLSLELSTTTKLTSLAVIFALVSTAGVLWKL